jgi:hypothetical protein
MFLEFAGKLARNGKFPDLDVSFDPPPKAPADGYEVIVRGIAKWENSQWRAQPGYKSDSLHLANRKDWSQDQKALVARSEFGFRLALQEQSERLRELYIPITKPDEAPAKAKLLQNYFAQTRLVESVVVPQGKRLVARSLHDGLFGTLTGTASRPRLVMPDGTAVSTPAAKDGLKLPLTGVFVIRQDNTPVEAAAIEPFRVAGEVVNVLLSSKEVSILLRVPGGKKTWTVRAPTEFQLLESADQKFKRRVRDLEVGDFVILYTDIMESGELITSAAATARPLVTNIGQSDPPKDTETTQLREGKNALTPLELLTESSQKRNIWVAADSALPKGLFLAPAMPVIDARTITLLRTVGGKRFERLDPTQAEQDSPDLEPIHASVSDAIARWSGWSLVVPEPGSGDRVDEQIATGQQRREPPPFILKASVPSEFKLPRLREKHRYDFRLRNVDLAGNHGLDEPIQKLDNEHNWISSLQEPYSRPQSQPPSPILAIKDRGGRLSVPTGPSENENTSASYQNARRLIYVSDPITDPSGVCGVILAPSALWPLPPACAVTTVIKNGRFDKVSSPEALFDQHERYFEDGTYVLDRGNLNYFPDPLVYPAIGGLQACIAVADQSGSVFRDPDSGTLAVTSPFDLVGRKTWPSCIPPKLTVKGGNLPRVVLQGRTVVLSLPPSWSGWGQIRNGDPTSPDLWTDFQIVHATIAPRLRPRWLSLASDPGKNQNEQVDRLTAQLEIHHRSTGALGLAAYWNEYWDETTPLHFVEPTVTCDVLNGTLRNITVEKPGAGFGTTCRFVFWEPNGSQLSADQLPKLAATLTGGKLHSIDIIEPGSNLPDALKVRILRRPPLIGFADAEVVIGKGGRISGITILNPGGFYANPPFVLFEDPKGEGHGAEAFALLNGNGQVSGVGFHLDPERGKERKGESYSTETTVRFFTHSKILPEIPPSPVAIPSAQEFRAERRKQLFVSSYGFRFEHPFGDTHSREAFYVASGNTRSREILCENGANGKIAPRPRNSLAHRVEIKSSARPSRAEWRRTSYAYKWSTNPKGEWPFKIAYHERRLVIRREAAIRCYFRRGWNTSGRELLGIVVMNAQVNSIALDDSVPGANIPKGMRGLVSRWG